MSLYINQANISDRFAALKLWADRDGDGAIDAGIVERAIADAEAEVNAPISQVYTLPLTLGDANTAAMVRNAAILLASWKLASGVNDMAAQDAMRDEYKTVQAWLRDILSGKVKLAGETVTEVAMPSGRPIIKGDTTRVSRDSMKGW